MLTVECVTIDCHNPALLADFWAELLDWEIAQQSESEAVLQPRNRELVLSPVLLFLKAPDDKMTKNRLHLDLRPDNQAVEVARAEALGAKRIEIGQSADPATTWVVMADPEGNEFCILLSL
ncbi:MAG: VOC family protein [Candidatus Nanopelagicales bacterium]